MPEGDTIHLARRRIAPVLEAEPLQRFWARKLRGHTPRAGQLVEGVRVHGKHLLIDLDRSLTLQVHLGMGGWWAAEPGEIDSDEVFERHRRTPRLRLYLATRRGLALCYSAPTIQTFMRGDEPDRLTPLSNLGPDVAVEPDRAPEMAAEALARLRARLPDTELVADALLDQEVAAGIGNAYKSEVLFHRRINPFTAIGSLGDEQILALYTTANRLLRINIERPGPRRTTTPLAGAGEGHDAFVYHRHRAPCRRCGTSIERSYRGRTGRSTYWCPQCQPDR